MISSPKASSRKVLFLDRDGVINIDTGFVHRRDEFVFVEGIFDIGRYALAAGYSIVVVTNQSGIGRGYYSEAQFAELTAWMEKQFAEESIPILKTYYCPHHPTEALPEYRRECECRKPQPGMFLQARDEFDIDLPNSVLIGDAERDIQAANAAGLTKTIKIGANHLPKVETMAHLFTS